MSTARVGTKLTTEVALGPFSKRAKLMPSVSSSRRCP
jgi:hypothetical protein